MTYIPPMQVLTKHERDELRKQHALWYGIRAIRAVVTIDALELALKDEHDRAVRYAEEAKIETHIPSYCNVCTLLEALGREP